MTVLKGAPARRRIIVCFESERKKIEPTNQKLQFYFIFLSLFNLSGEEMREISWVVCGSGPPPCRRRERCLTSRLLALASCWSIMNVLTDAVPLFVFFCFFKFSVAPIFFPLFWFFFLFVLFFPEILSHCLN